MRPLLSLAEIRQADRDAREVWGFPEVVLIENAGQRAWCALRSWKVFRQFSHPKILILAGGGHNGADALVLARWAVLSRACEVQVLLAPKPPTEALLVQKKILEALGVSLQIWKADQELPHADVLVDGLVGTGARGDLEVSLGALVQKACLHPGVKVSLDLPTGLGTPTVLKADLTLSLGFPKTLGYAPGLRSCCGKIIEVDIGFPPELGRGFPGRLVRSRDRKGLLPPILPEAYKGRRGHLGIVGGQRGTAGAPVLASQGGAAARAGLVTVFTSPDIRPVLENKLTSAMVRSWDQEPFPWEMFQALVVGPGGVPGEFVSQCIHQAQERNIPLVLDAGALDHLGTEPLPGIVLTPHLGEFSRMTGLRVGELKKSPLEPLRAWARDRQSWVVLKSTTVMIAAPDGRYWFVDGRQPALGTAGSGDVLAGVIGGLLASGASFEAGTIAGVLAHQKAGRRAWKAKGWFTAEDLPGAVAQVLKEKT